MSLHWKWLRTMAAFGCQLTAACSQTNQQHQHVSISGNCLVLVGVLLYKQIHLYQVPQHAVELDAAGWDLLTLPAFAREQSGLIKAVCFYQVLMQMQFRRPLDKQ